ncbi:MAG: holo-acyl-carrier-protein synthase [Deltaproteobacteria bacterium]|nr:holo-acyl-carrier-protein synthase [Deltaproteobacteria bacterium]
MIIGIGTDIVSIQRIEKAVERFGERFINKVFTDEEANFCKSKKERAPYLAARFAAKEAVLKALGTGISNGIGFKDVEVARVQGKRPEIILHGIGKKVAESLGIKDIHISISHEADIALAFAVIEG